MPIIAVGNLPTGPPDMTSKWKRGGGESRNIQNLLTNCVDFSDEAGEGVNISEILVDVMYGSPVGRLPAAMMGI